MNTYALTMSPVAMSLEELIPSSHSKSYMYSILIRTALVVSTLIVGLSIPFFGEFPFTRCMLRSLQLVLARFSTIMSLFCDTCSSQFSYETGQDLDPNTTKHCQDYRFALHIYSNSTRFLPHRSRDGSDRLFTHHASSKYSFLPLVTPSCLRQHAFYYILQHGFTFTDVHSSMRMLLEHLEGEGLRISGKSSISHIRFCRSFSH